MREVAIFVSLLVLTFQVQAADMPPQGKGSLTRVFSAERRLEDTSTDEPRNGYVENWFGGYDRLDLTEKVIDGYRECLASDPENLEIKYRFAGALARALRFAEARQLYLDLTPKNDSAYLMLAMIELKSGDRSAAEVMLLKYNQAQDYRGLPFLKKTLEQIDLTRKDDAPY